MEPDREQSPAVALDAPARRLLPLVAAACLVATVVGVSVPAGRDTVQDGWTWSAGTAAGLSWFPLLAIVACSLGHYVLAASCTRAATASRLPLGEATAAQLCASTANKITPAGLGGSAVLARYLVRRCGVHTSEAVGSVAVIALARAVSAVVILAALALGAPLFGFNDGLAAVSRLLLRLQASPVVPWVGAGVALLAVTGAVLARRGRRSRPRLSELVTSLRVVASSPTRSATLLLASAGQSLVLATAFACATVTLPGPRPSASLMALVVGYLLAVAVAAAVPMPGGIGSSEAALTAVLVAAHVPLGHALVDVTLFRVLTLWIPAAAGLPCARVLRRRGAL